MIVHFLLQGTSFTGGRAILIDHARALMQRGHEVVIFTVGSEAQAIDWAPGPLIVRPLAGGDELPPGDACLFERPSLAPWVLRRFTGTPIQFVQGFEGADAEIRRDAARRSRRIVQWLKMTVRVRKIDRAYRLPTTKFVVHPHLGALIRKRFSQTAQLVPNGLPDGLFHPPAHRSYDGKTLLIVGPTDTPSKRMMDALHAAAIAKQKLPGLRVVRIAQHPMRPIEADLNVTDAYHTMQTPAQMAEHYRQADAVLLPYNAAEGFGLPAVEAMATGTPVVLTDIPAFRSFAVPDDYALFVPVGKVETMADAVVRLFSDARLRQRLAARGPQAAARYTRQRSHDAMEQALKQVAHHGRS